MSAKRRIHSDVIGTLIYYDGEQTRAGEMIISFLKAANDHGHETRTVSSGGTDFDKDIKEAFNNASEFLLPTTDKGLLMKNITKNEDPVHDIIIDDDPMMKPDDFGFHFFANHHIDPNSKNLEDDLKTIAREQLGFEWNGPK